MIRWLILAAAVSGCALYSGNPDDSGDGCDPLLPGPIDPDGLHYQYVIDSIDTPTTVFEVSAFGFNLDDDELGRVDNALGQIIGVLSGITDEQTTLDDEIQERIDAGQLIHLLDVQTVSTESADAVGVTAYLGSDPDGDPTDNWPGPERYLVRVTGEPLVGTVRDGVIHAELGHVPLELVLPNVPAPIRLDAYAARIEARFDGERLVGTIGGALREDEARAAYLPAMHVAIQYVIDRDCPDGACPDNTLGDTVASLFDEDRDGTVTLAEVERNSLIKSLFSPDVDMFDTEGELSPRCDGVNDSLSIGVGFTAVPAEL